MMWDRHPADSNERLETGPTLKCRLGIAPDEAARRKDPDAVAFAAPPQAMSCESWCSRPTIGTLDSQTSAHLPQLLQTFAGS